MNTNENSRESAETATVRAHAPDGQRLVLALTQDASLTHALEELANLRVAVVQVTDAGSLVEQLLVSGPSIALIDAQSLATPLELLIDQLVRQFPDLRLLVAGHALEQMQLAARIAQGQVFRFVHKPASAQRLKLFVDAANRPLDGTRAPTAAPAALEPAREPVSRPAPAAPSVAGPERPRGDKPSRLPMAAIVAGAAAVAVIAGVLMTRGGGDKAAPAPTAATPAASAPAASARPRPAGDVEALIRSADQAFAALRFVSREGNSAAELYQKVLQIDPQDGRARSGFTRSIDFAVRNAETAFTAGKFADADAIIAAVLAVSPGNSRVGFLQSQLQRERERSAVDENRRLSVEARQEKLRGLLSQANDRLRRNAFIEPERDNALALLGAAQDVAPNDAEVRALRDRLGARMVEVAGQKLDAGDVAGARTLLDAAGSLGSANAAVVKMRHRADEMSVAPAPAATTPAVAVVAPANAAVATPAAATSTPAPAPEPVAAPDPTPTTRGTDTLKIYARSELTLLRTSEVEYPQRALTTSQAGWVDLEYTVGTDGTVKNIMVLGAEPKNVFDNSAVQAVRRWRYAPVVENGKAVEARTRMRLRFTPPTDR